MKSDLAQAAAALLLLHQRYPDLFDHVLPISEDDMMTLRELAFGGDRDEEEL